MKNIKPFIKWAGGKTQLLDEIRNTLPDNFNTYVEPFVGGGAVLFDILQNHPGIIAVINDTNEKLMTTYRIVRDDVDRLIQKLKKIETEYYASTDKKQYYLKQRSIFNSTGDDMEIASLFIFLNKTAFNGLYRVNKRGEFNVPFGKYDKPKICDEETLRADSEALQGVKIFSCDYSRTIIYAGASTLYYFDPPYRPISDTSFTDYTSGGFDDEQQIRLGLFCKVISDMDAKFILNNSDPKNGDPDDDFFDILYEDFNIKRIFAKRSINSNPNKRGKISELLINNF